MSVIAYTSAFFSPVLIGDILITATYRKENEQDIEIPTFLKRFNQLSNNNDDIIPINLSQKIYVINDKLAIGLLGSVYEMKMFLKDLRNNFLYREINIQNLQNFWNEYDKQEFKNSSYIFLMAFEEKGRTKFYYQMEKCWNNNTSKLFNCTYASGTGSERFLEEVINTNKITTNWNIGSSKSAVALNYITLVNLIGSERFTASTIKDLWGAGFEMIAFENGKFKKIDDITFIIWNINVNQNKEITKQPTYAVNYKYYEDVLVITSTDFINIKMYEVPPIDSSIDELYPYQSSLKPYFESNKVACCYLIKYPHGDIKIKSYFIEALDLEVEHLISVSLLANKQIQIKINSNFENQMLQDIEQI